MLENDSLFADRICPVYNREISCELCCETVQVFDGLIKHNSVPELKSINDLDTAKEKCSHCCYGECLEE